ncbi:reverse transcriptase [Senna tora]|uniref:Reverse transcriptase n=1 Tax=Senna tora TaxID=362788 RepID=A0A834SW95_9FABA|nr:reverse transcriptase [Senna tora]
MPGGCSDFDWRADAIVEDTVNLLNSFPNASISFANRSLNKAADWLAKASLLRMCPLDWVGNHHPATTILFGFHSF